MLAWHREERDKSVDLGSLRMLERTRKHSPLAPPAGTQANL